MWRRTPHPSRDAEGERPQKPQPESYPPGTSPDKPAHHPHHSARPPPSPHPSASTYTDKSFRLRAASARREDNVPAAHSAHTAQTLHRSPAPRSTRFPASASPRPSPTQTPDGSAAHPDLRCAKSTAHDFLSRAPRPSKTSAHAPDAAVQSEKAQGVHGRSKSNRWTRGLSLLSRQLPAVKVAQ